ncbi:MAG: PEP-CTERM sorting domain-containing protein [Bythopirellula sp.]|nr:PEP-CTERM sorting domain-containing protein [Bythopirellula sp.]
MPIAIPIDRRSRSALGIAVRMGLLLATLFGPSSASAELFEEIGFTQLKNTLTSIGVPVPLGDGVPISLVEAGGSSNSSYWPNSGSNEFGASSDPLGLAVAFSDGSGNANMVNPSNHASSQARNFFGNTTSVAPGANAVIVYEAGLFLDNQLGAPVGGTPQFLDFRVQNHSWVGSFAVDDANPTPTEISQDVSTLRRFDFMINRDNLTAIVGLHNVIAPLPHLLGQSYNALAIGRTDGLHSTGLTNLTNYGPGRSKPDLVAPRDTTSAATSTTSSIATLLHSVVIGSDAARSEVMKAMLMAGATKNEFTSWSRTTTQPLDDTFGAGEVNVYNSYLMTQGGRYAGTSAPVEAVGSHGWDYQTIQPGAANELKYKFVIPTGSTAPELSILLTWNVNVPGGFGSQTLANMDLTLTDALGQTVDQSLSTLDNVEHIYLTDLAAGDYTLTITSDTARDFGLAWRTSTLFDQPSADFDEDGDVDGRDFLTWQRGFGILINATHAQGDANGDGAVMTDDLMLIHAQYGPTVVDPPVLATITAVPEPGSAVLIGSGMLMFLFARRRCV